MTDPELIRKAHEMSREIQKTAGDRKEYGAYNSTAGVMRQRAEMLDQLADALEARREALREALTLVHNAQILIAPEKP